MISTLAQVTFAPMDEHVSPFRLVQGGGWLMVLLFVCSIVAVGVFIERMLYYKRCRMNVNEFLAGVLALVRRQSYAEAVARCEEGHGPVVRVVLTAIYKRHLPANELREIVREIAQLEIPQLETNVSLLGTIGYIAPLLGLFGTVSGLIEAFVKINRTSGTASVGDLSQGITWRWRRRRRGWSWRSRATWRIIFSSRRCIASWPTWSGPGSRRSTP
jgi:biopolymer transport protein ExbB